MGVDLRVGMIYCATLVLLAATNAEAGGLSIWPLQVNLPDDGVVQELQISNPTEEASYVQVMAVEWHEPGQIEQAERVDEILAVPPVFELSPHSSQLVRIAARGQVEAAAERPYRLMITEVPRIAGLVPNSLAIAARMTLPIFVTPEGASPLPVWSLEGQDKARPKLMLVNQGNAHIKVNKVELVDAAAEPAFLTEEASLVLAGDEKRWPLEVDLARLKGPVTLRAETTTGPIETQLSLPDGSAP